LVVDDELQLALGALGGYRLAVHRGGHAGGHLNGLLTNTRHVAVLVLLLLASARSEDLAEHLAAYVLLARLMIRHHALRRGQDRDAEAVGDRRDRLDRHVDAAAGLGNAGDLAD